MRQAFAIQATFLILSLACPAARGQGTAPGAPVPGAPVPGAPVPGVAAAGKFQQPGPGSAYQSLPISINDAISRIEELKSLLPECRPQDMQEPVQQLCEWLADIAEGHNKLANSFSRQEATRPHADAERRTAQRFAYLKNQAQLMKAELLIRQKRYPEALSPLIEIVVAEPKSATGQAAYKKLKEIGFSEEVEIKPAETASNLAPGSVVPVDPQSAQTQPGQPAPSVAAKPAPVTAPPVTVPPVRAVSAKPAVKPAQGSTVWITGSPTGAPRR